MSNDIPIENFNDPPHEVDDDVKGLMADHDLDQDTAEKVQEIMDEYGVDEDDAIELEEAGV